MEINSLTHEEYCLLIACFSCMVTTEPALTKDVLKLEKRLFGPDHKKKYHAALAKFNVENGHGEENN